MVYLRILMLNLLLLLLLMLLLHHHLLLLGVILVVSGRVAPLLVLHVLLLCMPCSCVSIVPLIVRRCVVVTHCDA